MLLLVLCFIVLTHECLKAQEETKQETKLELTELQKLKIENLKLKINVAQLQATLSDRENKLASVELSNEQTTLLAELRKQLQADEKATFDWNALSFAAPK